MAYNLTQEELTSILAFVNGENADVLSTDVPRRFMALSGAFQMKMLESMNAARSRCKQKERALERIQGRLAGQVNSAQFGELSLSSTEVAYAVVYLLRELQRFESMRQVNLILYQFYARWLHETMDRPWENDKPALQEWGPYFWGAARSLEKSGFSVGRYEDFERIAKYGESGPMMANILKNVVKKYSGLSERGLQKECMDSFPYQNALKKKNETGAKWGEKISDVDLYYWKQ